MRILPVNRSTVLVELRDLDEVLALHASLTSQPLDGIEELLPAARTLMLRFDPDRLSTKAIEEALAQRDTTMQQGASRASWGSVVEIPMRYDGEDLAEVAQLVGLEVDDIIRRHQESEFTVAFCGFAPGFAYLVGGDPALQVPRRLTPRPQVPAGSVALGGVYCGVYPQATPGGWRIIGATSLKMWDVDRDPPALLTPGTRVRFREVGVGVGVVAADLTWNNWSSLMFPKIEERRVKDHAKTTVYDGSDYSQAARGRRPVRSRQNDSRGLQAVRGDR